MNFILTTVKLVPSALVELFEDEDIHNLIEVEQYQLAETIVAKKFCGHQCTFATDFLQAELARLLYYSSYLSLLYCFG